MTFDVGVVVRLFVVCWLLALFVAVCGVSALCAVVRRCCCCSVVVAGCCFGVRWSLSVVVCCLSLIAVVVVCRWWSLLIVVRCVRLFVRCVVAVDCRCARWPLLRFVVMGCSLSVVNC